MVMVPKAKYSLNRVKDTIPLSNYKINNQIPFNTEGRRMHYYRIKPHLMIIDFIFTHYEVSHGMNTRFKKNVVAGKTRFQK